MSTTRKLRRQLAKNKAVNLSHGGKHGKTSKIFKELWKGEQIKTGTGRAGSKRIRQRDRESKQDTDIKALIERARQQEHKDR